MHMLCKYVFGMNKNTKKVKFIKVENPLEIHSQAHGFILVMGTAYFS
jgi:hypothetical protein